MRRETVALVPVALRPSAPAARKPAAPNAAVSVSRTALRVIIPRPSRLPSRLVRCFIPRIVPPPCRIYVRGGQTDLDEPGRRCECPGGTSASRRRPGSLSPHCWLRRCSSHGQLLRATRPPQQPHNGEQVPDNE